MQINKFHHTLSVLTIALFLGAASLFTSCEKEDFQPVTSEEEEIEFIEDTDGNDLSKAIYSSRKVDFNRTNGSSYGSSQANSDFGSVSGWSTNEGSATIESGALRIKLVKNQHGTAYGMESRVDVSDGTEYSVQYNVKFKSGFKFSRGGKLGWGFATGNGVTGCRASDARSGKGGSFRAMWYDSRGSQSREGGTAYFRPYLYYKGMSGDCGVHFSKRWPSSGGLKANQWYTIKLYYKQNTSNTRSDGKAQMYVNGTRILNQSNIRWGDSSFDRKVRQLYFSTFRGGGSSTWRATNDGYLRFGYVQWKRIAS